MKACHDDMGHLGVEHTLHLLRVRFYWPSMAKDTESPIETCDHCLKFKSKPHKVELQNIEMMHPLQLVCIDFLMIESGKSNKEVNILVITDHFTKYSKPYLQNLLGVLLLRHFGRSILCIMTFPKRA